MDALSGCWWNIEKRARWELHKNATFYFVLNGNNTPQNHSSTATSHHRNHPNHMNKIYKHYWWSKDKFIRSILLWTPSHGHTSHGWPAKTSIHLLCVDTECRLEDLPGPMDNSNDVNTTLWCVIPEYYCIKF